MGQKVRPTGFRVGIMTDWLSQWYATKADFSDLLVEDTRIRAFIKQRYGGSGISRPRVLSMIRQRGMSSQSTNVTATPVAPARPVRPMRCV